MKNLTKQDYPVVLSITETATEAQVESGVTIRRNEIRRTETNQDGTKMYLHAREIYFRARRQRPVRAASIF
jgi:hypothetical protein